MLVIREGSPATIHEVISYAVGRVKYQREITSTNLIDFGSAVILPGFFDMHFHWVQDDVREMPKASLLKWLENYTFPAESKFKSARYSKQKATVFFKRLSSVGTLGGGCYSSIHWCALEAALKNVKGDFVVGNVLMDMNAPKELLQTEGEALAITRRAISKFGRRVAFTPRFAITTTPKVMTAGGLLADQAGCFKQSHLSETPQEIEFVLGLFRKLKGFEKVRSYTDIYHKTNMLGPRSLMAHGIHLTHPELKTLQQTKTAIVHCPTSNAPVKERGIGSGLFDFKRIERAKIRWALGSDIGGGPFLSMLDVMRSFVDQNKSAGISGATGVKALYRATLAGAEILQVSARTGNLDAGKEANFIVLPLEKNIRIKTAESLLQAILKRDSKKRSRYDDRVSYVSFQGKTLFDRLSTKSVTSK